LVNQNGRGDFQIYTKINLRPRPDSGEINSSPVTSVVPNLQARTGCEHRVVIATSDPDGDPVRCRWGEDATNDDDGIGECASSHCRTLAEPPFNAVLIEDTCELSWTPPVSGLYVVNIVIEDYISGTAPPNVLSEVPLQFLIQVVDSNLTCEEKPEFQFLPESNCFDIPDGDTFSEILGVHHTHADNVNFMPSRLIRSVPIGMTVSPLSEVLFDLKSSTVTWTPTTDQYGRHYFACFVALDDVGSASDQVCLKLITGTSPPSPFPEAHPSTQATFSPTEENAKISFTKKVRRPSASRFIRVFEYDSDYLVVAIDTSSSPAVELFDETIGLNLTANYLFNTSYYILMDYGAFVGTFVHCSGNRPNADGILGKNDWVFTTPKCTGHSDCQANAHCNGFKCECLPGYEFVDRFDCVNIDECRAGTHVCDHNADCEDTEGSFTCTCKAGFSGDGIISCHRDSSVCSEDWSIQRNRWIDQSEDWKDTTKNCSTLGDNLPTPTYNPRDDPGEQWKDLLYDYLHNLNASLKAAADKIPGIPSSVYFNETDPEKLWLQIMDFFDYINDIWYSHIGEPNGIFQLTGSAPGDACGNRDIQRWLDTTTDNEHAQNGFTEAFHGRCDDC
jgi:hypothetical protein